MYKNVFGFIVAIVIVGIMVVIIGYLMVMGRPALLPSTIAPSSASSQQLVASILPSPAPSVEASTWKTYQNSSYGYEIKYPQDFQLTEGWHGENTDRSQTIQHKVKKSNIIEIQVVMHPAAYDKFGNVTTYEDAKPADLASFVSFANDYIDKMLKDLSENLKKDFSKKQIEFNGYPAIFLYDTKSTIGDKIFVYHNQHVFLLSYTAFNEYVETVDKILSTFQFSR
jgi:hypothetical protein